MLPFKDPDFWVQTAVSAKDNAFMVMFPDMAHDNDAHVARAREIASVVESALKRRHIDVSFDEHLGSGEFPVQSIEGFSGPDTKNACFYLFHPQREFGGDSQIKDICVTASNALNALQVVLTPSDSVEQQTQKIEEFRLGIERGNLDTILSTASNPLLAMNVPNAFSANTANYGAETGDGAKNGKHRTMRDEIADAIKAAVAEYNTVAGEGKAIDALAYTDALTKACATAAITNLKDRKFEKHMYRAVENALEGLLLPKGRKDYLTGLITDAVVPVISQAKERGRGV